MATTVVKTIGSTGDYSTLHAWYDDRKGDLVTRNTIEVAELLGESHYFKACLYMYGDTVDSEHYFVIRPVTGAHFRGDFGNLDGQAVIRPGPSWGGVEVFNCFDSYTKFIGFAVVNFSTFYTFFVGLRDLLFSGIGISNNLGIYGSSTGIFIDCYDGTNTVINNCVFSDLLTAGIFTT